MARIKGIDIPNDKRIEVSLTYIYGIGRKLSKTILTNAGVDLNKKAKDLTEEELASITPGAFWHQKMFDVPKRHNGQIDVVFALKEKGFI